MKRHRRAAASVACVLACAIGWVASAAAAPANSAAGRAAAPPARRPQMHAPSAPGADSTSVVESRLLQAYLPKEDLGITRFLKEHPLADGRGVLVAILDTGVDLRHPGLLQTPQGERKIVDVYDATDNGLCDLPLAVSTSDSALTGLTGRRLRLGPARSENGEYRLGRLSAREVLPGGLTARLLEERRKERDRLVESWENRVAALEGAILRRSKTADADSALPPDRENLYRKLRRQADHEFRDPGPVYDLVAFRRAGAWLLLIDTDGDGDLSGETPLAPYRVRGDVAVFPPPASLSMALSWIAEDASQVSLFFDQGGHGTHVAGIVGAYYGPDDPLNGLAPGVRFLAVKVGNGRLGGSTSHNSILKAISWAVEHGAMVANLSFGGTSYFDDGHEITSAYFDKVVQNHGIFITASAGNEGPGLSTIGSPGTARRVFTLGAAISPWTMMASYGGLPGELPKEIRMFHFSSRGPLTNGSPGVDFVTPGAALSTLPTWLLTRNENWNGTSMAAPQAAGCLALLISACLQDSVPVSPPRMDRALRASAIPLEGVSYVEQGAGLIQVPDAYEALKELARAFPVIQARASGSRGPTTSIITSGFVAPPDSVQVPDIGIPATRDPVTFWRIETENATGTGEGYYERDLETAEPYFQTFYVAPDLPPLGSNPLRTRFNRVVRLRSTVPWMQAPPQVSIPASGVSIRVKCDPAKMTPGLNVGRIQLLDLATSTKPGATRPVPGALGTETDLLATVVRPETTAPPEYQLVRTFDLAPGERQAFFVKVPGGATRVRLHLLEERADPANGVYVAVTALSLLHPPQALRDEIRLDLRRADERTLYQRVEPGTVAEFAFFSRWVNTGPGRLTVTVSFDGLASLAGLGSSARLNGEQDAAARWGERPLVIPPERDGTVLPVRSMLKGLDVTASVSLAGTEEPLDVTWDLRPDSLYTRPLEDSRALLLRGRGWVRLDRSETATIDLRDSPDLEDFLDDCFLRLFTPAGRLVYTANISNGPFAVKAPEDGPSPGWYQMEFSVFGLGNEYIQHGPPFSPVLIRTGVSGSLTLFHSPGSGYTSGPDSSRNFSLLRGEGRSLYIKARGLPEDRDVIGQVSFSDDDDEDAPALLQIPVRFSRRDLPPDPEASLRAAVSTLEEGSRRALTLPPGPAAGSGELDKAETLLRAWKGEDYDTSDEAWDLLFLRTDLLLRHGQDGQTPREVGRLLDLADRRLEAWRKKQKEKDAALRSRATPDPMASTEPNPSDLAERHERERRIQGAVLLRRSRLALKQGNAAEARGLLVQASSFGFGGDDPSSVLAEVLIREGRALDALEPLQEALKSDPWNPALARREVEAFLDLGWTDLAGEALDRWLDRFPVERDAFQALTARLARTPRATETRASLAD